MTSIDQLLWEYCCEEPAHFQDYASLIRVYSDRIEYTTGWTEPQFHIVPAKDILWVKQGAMSQRNIIIIMTTESWPHEIITHWGYSIKEEFLEAVEKIVGGRGSV